MTHSNPYTELRNYFEKSGIFNDNCFVPMNSGDEWQRILPDVHQRFVFNVTRSNRLRVRVFSEISNYEPICIGGDLTRAGVDGANSFGTDFLWEINHSTSTKVKGLFDLEICIRHLAIPWLELTAKSENIRILADLFPRSVKSKQEVNYREPLKMSVESKNIGIKDIKVNQQFPTAELFTQISSFLKNKGFHLVDGDDFSFIRERNYIYDVLFFEPTNYNMHVGCYGFNWIEKLALDGSGQYSSDHAFMLNGGSADENGRTGYGGSWGFELLENGQVSSALLEVLDSQVIPKLEEVKTEDALISTLPENKKSMAQHFGII